ncbi:unnamed protein product [Ranitomeya imitator]|uniref:Reverse transcriptase domain-containing protein n=1 Tax=Ranitomeya imitator TaxID=111125 RepID=A0ABN9LAW8_9NEOB|nr:unnamed protein product [Ranitomeya imitator]
MSTDTFAYDLATSSTILSQVTGSNEFLRTPVHELRTRDFERESRRLISYDLHSTTLAEYHKQSKIPRGLRCNLHPTLFSDNPEYCEKYKKILNKCSLDIIVLTVEYLQKAIAETKQNIQTIETQLTATLSSAEWTTLKEKTEKALAEHRKNLQERKRQKFQRDSEDYSNNRVYKWTDSSTTRNPWRRPRFPRNNGSFSSGSDSSTTSGRQHFLAKGRRGGYRHGDAQGDQSERMTTRSQKILTPLIKNTQSFLLDTGHFLSTIRQLDTVPPGSTLVTLDVNSLYTSIQHSKGMEATKYLLQLSNMSSNAIQFCLDLLHIVLYENYFLSGDTFYVQRCGTAMGSNVAPAYANAFMNFFEITHMYTNDLFRQHILSYHRYIDDIFFIWTGTTELLMSFHSQLNFILPELQFTIHHDKKSVPFLDTRVLLDFQGHLTTDLYCKPTDCNSLLHYTSCHPRSMKNSLPRSQFNRVSRIVSDPIIRKDRLSTVAQKFQQRHYPNRLLQEEKTHALTPQSPSPPRHTVERVPFVHTYHPLIPKVHSIIRKHWPLLSKAYPDIKTFGEPVLMCTKRPPNIKDKLVRADIGSTRPNTTQKLLSSRRNDSLAYHDPSEYDEGSGGAETSLIAFLKYSVMLPEHI